MANTTGRARTAAAIRWHQACLPFTCHPFSHGHPVMRPQRPQTGYNRAQHSLASPPITGKIAHITRTEIYMRTPHAVP